MRKTVWVLFWLFTAALTSTAQTTLYFPQVADGIQGASVWLTSFGVTNPAAAGSGTATGTITFSQSDGSAFVIPFGDLNGNPVGSGNTVPFQLAGGQTFFFGTTGTAAINTGFATLTSNLPVQAAALFQEFICASPSTLQGCTFVGQAVVPAATPLARQALIVTKNGQSDTGVAIANPNNAAATVTLQLLDTNGVASVAPATIVLQAKNHAARFVQELFPSVTGSFFGTMQITTSASTPLVTTPLYFPGGNGPFSTGPVVTLASLLNPAIEWLRPRPWPSPAASIARLPLNSQPPCGINAGNAEAVCASLRYENDRQRI